MAGSTAVRECVCVGREDMRQHLLMGPQKTAQQRGHNRPTIEDKQARARQRKTHTMGRTQTLSTRPYPKANPCALVDSPSSNPLRATLATPGHTRTHTHNLTSNSRGKGTVVGGSVNCTR